MTVPEDRGRCLVVGRRPEGFWLLAGFVGEAEQRDLERWILGNFAWEERRVARRTLRGRLVRSAIPIHVG